MAGLEMECRPLGRCGTRVSALGLGGWTTFGASVTAPATVRAILRAARDAGVNFFDIADAYAAGAAERMMGEVLREFPRHELVISSKVYFPMSRDTNDRGLSRKHILESVDKSLARIGTDYLDIYFCHRFDAETPLEETARAMDDLVGRGKILYWGISEWTGDQIRNVCKLCKELHLYRPQTEQPEYSLLARGKFESDVRPALEKAGMGAVVWSPLRSGVLTGKYDDGLPPDSRLAQIEWLRKEVHVQQDLDRVRRFKELADALGCSRAQLAIAWAAAQPGVSSVILGATRLEQLQENLASLRVRLDEDVARKLEGLFPPRGGAA